jgi:hypothetical protein
MPLVLAAAALILALLPALVCLRNLFVYRPAPWPAGATPEISILIPARNESESIEAAVRAALASRGATIEVVVLDDHSEDDTADRVAALAKADPRVRMVSAPPLPTGWCGKQHACAVLAGEARYDLLAFQDADVRLAPDGVARLAAFQQRVDAALVSGIPRQETGTLAEKLVIPLVHFVLLGFLPTWRMRGSASPAYGAGCGQLFLARRAEYQRMGGHAAVRASLHDGVTLPRAFRAAGLRTDLCDATDLATCRMYRGLSALWSGLAKNATEGLAAPALIVPATLVLVGGQVLPLVLVCASPFLSTSAFHLALAALAASYSTRLALTIRFRQSQLGAALHPLGVLLLLAIQWYALGRVLLGKPSGWKGRNYARSITSPAASGDARPSISG